MAWKNAHGVVVARGRPAGQNSIRAWRERSMRRTRSNTETPINDQLNQVTDKRGPTGSRRPPDARAKARATAKPSPTIVPMHQVLKCLIGELERIRP